MGWLKKSDKRGQAEPEQEPDGREADQAGQAGQAGQVDKVGDSGDSESEAIAANHAAVIAATATVVV